jgi:hypothetical protein
MSHPAVLPIHPATNLLVFEALQARLTDGIKQAAGSFPGAWCVEGHQDYEGRYSIVVFSSQDSELSPNFLLQPATLGWAADLIIGDELHHLGSFVDLAGALSGIATCIEACADDRQASAVAMQAVSRSALQPDRQTAANSDSAWSTNS